MASGPQLMCTFSHVLCSAISLIPHLHTKICFCCLHTHANYILNIYICTTHASNRKPTAAAFYASTLFALLEHTQILQNVFFKFSICTTSDARRENTYKLLLCTYLVCMAVETLLVRVTLRANRTANKKNKRLKITNK